ncbi:acyl carrier protein [Actinoalloteichus hymeniacidonis]|uniref:Acyl carrier protein n=1 Tax=Actinoalloteichus hymeniacidonis TaxID=340345 RepID=A0AAC9N172_9PSEU|nr:acyl carrier protein [Actinoalloteichus hymeniacidonis]AOS65596.1 acyl carrier protein [Actinoalloteichus hymeniacidonis]MBB5906314.1 acyl carrier protein [Actinoalloteichus hymeniacidonis]
MTQGIADGVRDKIREIIANELELDPSELTESGHLVDDFDADSLSLITVVARIEKELGVVIPRDELPNLSTLGLVFSAVDRYGIGQADNA